MRLGITRIKLATGWLWVNKFYFLECGPWVQRKKERDLVLVDGSEVKIPDLGRLKRGPLGPQSSIGEASCGCAWCYRDNKRAIARCRYYVHLYIRMQAQVNFVHKTFMYNMEGVDCDLPQFIFGERHYIQFFTAISGTIGSTKQFSSHGPPRPLLSAWSTRYGGVVSLSSAYRYYCPKIKE